MRRARMPHAPLTRERQSPSSSPTPGGTPGGQGEHNPFAPPPEDSPDQPWQPRHHPMTDPGHGEQPHGGPGAGGGSGHGGDGNGSGGGWGPGGGGWGPGGGGNGSGSGQGDGGSGDGRGGSGDSNGGSGEGADGGQPPRPDQPPQPPAWGSQWSSRQPGRQGGGGFGDRPGERPTGPNGQRGPGLRWDPTDPAQRRARYALLSGMWAFFFALFSLPEIALLLGALATYWGVSSLRAKPPRPAPDQPAAALDAPPPAPDAVRTPLPAPRPQSAKPQATAAISGLVTGGIALAIVAATFSAQIVYQDYYTCVDDALTQQSRQTCEDLLPDQLRPLLSTDD